MFYYPDNFISLSEEALISLTPLAQSMLMVLCLPRCFHPSHFLLSVFLLVYFYSAAHFVSSCTRLTDLLIAVFY